jgi:cytochrome c oxidase assembly protein subunit 15
MLMGVLLALGPLVWVWLRYRHAAPAKRLRVLTLLTLFLTFDLVLFGAFTRLTDSGLGCPDWPGCYGSVSPLGATQEISQAQAAMPTGPVTPAKAWIEMIHRYLATGVGVLIMTLALATWVVWRRAKQNAGQLLPAVTPLWPAVTLVWVCLQGAFGALTVTMKLFPLIVTVHLLGGMGLLALLRAQSVRYALASGELRQTLLPTALRALLLAGTALLWWQIALGGWVSTNYAVLACTEFPSCQGSYWPPMDFKQAFTLWRELGQLKSGESISFQALTAIHYVHRLMSYVLIPVLMVLAWWLARVGMRGASRALALLLLWQFLSGLSNVVLGWPLVAAVAHTAGAAGLVMVLTGAISSTRAAARAHRFPPSGGVHQLVQALQRAGHALGVRGG